MRGVQMRRPSLYDLKDELGAMQVPLLIVVGDEDDHSIQPGVFLKRTVPRSGGTAGGLPPNSEQVARGFEQRGAEGFAPIYAESASRVQFQEKDPRGWKLFAERLAKHSVLGAANTMRGVQMRRPSLYDLKDELGAMQVPLLVVVGDEDDHSIQPGVFLKRTVPRSGLTMFPKSGHTLNLEEPALFNRVVAEFIAQVEAGRWGVRDPRADPEQIMRAE